MNKGTPGLGIHVSPQETNTSLLKLPPALEEWNTISQVVNSGPLKTLNSNTPPRGVSRAQTKSLGEGAVMVNFGSDWQGSEIDTVLGNEKSRLKSGARLLPQTSGEQKGIALEKAKRRSRVDLDIFLNSDICVEGGYLQGLAKVLIRKDSRKPQAILLSGGKLRVIGYESIAKEEERSVFYQCCADLSDVSSGLGAIYCSEPDEDGFKRANEGIHVLPFTLQLASSKEQGKPKGYMNTQSGISIRYIVMVSLRIKDSNSGKISISHFYRDCCVWPRLNPSVVLSPASRPIQMSISDGLAFGGSGKVILTASLHRLYWVAGQLCHIRFDITNNSNKHLKVLTLELFQVISTFKTRKSKLDTDDDNNQTTTATKQTARSTLTIGQPGTRGHASAKGWWVGVAPRSSQTFSHCIHLPVSLSSLLSIPVDLLAISQADSLSVPRGKLIEVSYNIRATISPGTFLSTDIHISIPIEIISFLSIDPPPLPVEVVTKDIKTLRSVNNSEQNTVDHLDPDDYSNDSDDEYSDDDPDELGNLSVHDDTDEVVQHVVSSARLDEENAPRFADLYYSSIQGISEIPETRIAPKLNKNGDEELPTLGPDIPKRATTRFADRVEEKIARRKNIMEEGVIIENTGVTTGQPYDSVMSHRNVLEAGLSPPESVSFAPHTTPVASLDPTKDINSIPPPKRRALIPSKDREASAVNDVIDAYIHPSGSTYCTATPPRQTMSGSGSNCVTPNRHPSIEMLMASATRPKSVKDKIRELEELAASSSDGV